MLVRGRFIYVFLALALFSGCAQTSDNSPDMSSPMPGTLSKLLAGSAVCFDVNRDFACGPTEPRALADASGNYSIEFGEFFRPGDAPLIVIADPVKSEATGVFSGPKVLSSAPGSRHVSLLTTIMAVKAVDQSLLKTDLSIPASENLLAPPPSGSEAAVFERSFLNLYFTMCEKHAKLGVANPWQEASTELMSHKIRLSATVDHVLGATAPGASAPPTVSVGDDVYTNVPMLKSGFLFGDAIDEVNFNTIDNPGCLNAIPTVKDAQDVSTFDYYFYVINDKEDLVNSMDINASLSLNLTTMSGSAQGEYLDDVEKHTNDVYALITMKAKTQKFEINGMQLAGIIDSPANYFPACTSDGAHYGDMLYMYMCDYDNFAKICGNRFVKSVLAGGEYYGLMHIQASDESNRRDIMVDLQGSYNNGVIDGSVKGDFKSHIDTMAQKYSATFRVRTAGPAFDLSSLKTAGAATSDPDPYLINSSDKFFHYADIFIGQVLDKNGDCYSADAYKKCAVAVDFSDYQDVAHAVRDADTEERKHISFKLLSDYMGLQSYSNYMDDIIAHEGSYSWSYNAAVPTWDSNGNPIKPYVYKNVTIDPDNDFWDTYYYTQSFMTILQDEYTSCLSGGSECSLIPLTYTIPQLQFKMPAIKNPMPRSCNDWIGFKGGMGNYIRVLTSAGTNAMVNTVCEMVDANDALTYLDISNNRSATPASPAVNYSRWDAADGAVVTTIFDQLRINPNIGRVQLLNAQVGQTQTGVVGGAIIGSTGKRDPSEPVSAELLRAVDCDPDDTPAVINIDLTGTGLKFASGLTFDATIASRYEISSTAKSWDEAKADAEAKGGYLVEINSVEEAAMIERLFGPTSFDSFWVGLKTAVDVTLKSKYQWQSDMRYYNVTPIGKDVWGAGFPQTVCTPIVPPPPKPLPPPPSPKPEPPYIEPYWDIHPYPKSIWYDNILYRASPAVAQECDETRTCAAADRNYSWGLTNVACGGLKRYIIEYPPAAVAHTAEVTNNGHTLNISVKDLTDDGKCVSVTPVGPVWLVPDSNP